MRNLQLAVILITYWCSICPLIEVLAVSLNESLWCLALPMRRILSRLTTADFLWFHRLWAWLHGSFYWLVVFQSALLLQSLYFCNLNALIINTNKFWNMVINHINQFRWIIRSYQQQFICRAKGLPLRLALTLPRTVLMGYCQYFIEEKFVII